MLILGHRGAVDLTAPENTLAAVERALAQGADGVEVDVRLTADGVPVCHHDPGMRRSAGDPRHVQAVRLAELPSTGGHPVPTLAEVLDLVADRGRLVVELKTPHWPAGAAVCTVTAVAHELRRHRLHDVVVSSFDRPRLLALRHCALPVRTGLLGRPGVPLGVLVRRASADGHEQAHAHVASLLARPDLVRTAVAQAISVTGWTVNRAADLERLQDAGVESVISDDPFLARAHLGVRTADRHGVHA